ncbi:hypothetical protein DYD21_11280 [Rhodohalobacter sp. SW132]|uniref:M56 family metallopeptidase n=1 Tax=Rhodohalobacter sp. SW132 TaxID=2293433 RepID=UPI000E280BB6|nr:M56 family metallopeptidase [Rhodohalobacter sp. SW132]REL33354.1 hypothetical protein DYD21_11280 [Rhodohalobacter sp. SW132]
MIFYLFKSTLCLALLFAVYHLYLEKENMPRFNRGYLLFSLLFSLIIPLLPVGIVDQILSLGASESSGAQNLQAVELSGDEETVAVSGTESGLISTSMMIKAGVSMYVFVTLLLLIRLTCKVESILHKVRRHARFYYKDSTVVLLKEQTAPFSFLGYIFLNEREYNSGKISREVLIHENAHIRQRHSWDILLIEILKSLFWFNPLYRYFKRSLQLNHEFLADRAVLQKTDRVKSYQKMLLKTLVGQQPAHLASSFNYSQIKKRMLMMNRQTSFQRSVLKMSSALPLLLSAAMLFGTDISALQNYGKVIGIEISDSENILLNNEEIHISKLSEQLTEFEDLPNRTIALRVHKNAYFGIVLDVQGVMREHRLFRFRYISIDEESPKYEEMVKSKIGALTDGIATVIEEYMSLSLTEQREEAERYYANIVHEHKLLEEKLETIRASHHFEVSSPPALPPSPEQRAGNE